MTLDDGFDELGIDRSDSFIQPAGMTYERALAIANGTLGPLRASSGPREEPRKRPATAEENEAEVAELHSQGLTDRQIMSRSGLGRVTVKRYRGLLGLEANHTVRGSVDWRSPEGQDTHEKIKELYDNGWPPIKIAERLHLDRASVKYSTNLIRQARAVAAKRAEQRRARIARGGKG